MINAYGVIVIGHISVKMIAVTHPNECARNGLIGCLVALAKITSHTSVVTSEQTSKSTACSKYSIPYAVA